ncbi:MAG: ABC transporter permease [Candidatus Thiodiazotropha taylori]
MAQWPAARSFLSSLLEFVAAALIVYSLIFLVADVLPLDPARAMLGPAASETSVAALRESLGLNQPIWSRYFDNLVRMLHGDFGPSFFFGRPAGTIVAETAPLTLGRALAALFLGTLAGAWVAYFAKGRKLPVVRGVLSVLQSTPALCLLVLFLWLFSRGLGVTPMQNWLLYEFLGIAAAAAYPAGAVGLLLCDRLNPVGNPPRHVEMLRFLHAPAERLRKIIFDESLPAALSVALNALLPTLTGITFMEFIFGLNGFGSIFIHSCERGDLSIIVAGSMTVAILFLFIQKLSDWFLHRLDPRLARQLPNASSP